MENKPAILVTGAGGRSVGYQILQALQLLGDKYRIIATDLGAFSYGLYKVSDRYLVPPAVSPEYLPAVQRIVDRERVRVILPGTPAEVLKLAAHRDLFAPHCIVVASPPEVVKLCSDKQVLQAWLMDHGISVPKGAGRQDWRSLVKECGFPIVGKPSQDASGSRGVAILNGESEVERYLENISEPVFFQQYVGSAETEYTVGVMVAQNGAIIDSIVLHRKLYGLSMGAQRVIKGRSYALSTGYSQGTVVRHQKIQAVCEDLAVRIGIRGPANIQLRFDNDQVFVFEVHPRFSGTTSIRAQVGFNEPDVLIRHCLFQEQFGRLNYQTNVTAIRALSNIIVPVAEMEGVPRA